MRKKTVALIYMNTSPSVGRGVGYVAGSIIEAGHSLLFYDTFYIPKEFIVHHILANDIDVVCVSSMSLNWNSAVEIINSIRAKKNVPILVGGTHAIILKEKINGKKNIDFVCTGEGEEMILKFLDALDAEDFSSVPNLAYNTHEGLKVNAVADPMDLQYLPRFPYQIFEESSIVDSRGFFSVTATRGCPYTCTFCSNTAYLNLYKKQYLRKRPVNDVITEIHSVMAAFSNRIKMILLADDMALYDVDYAKELFSAIHENFPVPYGFMARIERINPELVAHCKETGCAYVGMGVECGDEEFRSKTLGRHMTNDSIVNAFRLFRDAGIFTTSYNIVGFPVANDKSLTDATVDLNKKINPDYVQFTVFYPFPGTKLRDTWGHMIDPLKDTRAGNYYNESVFKGVDIKKVMGDLQEMFNPKGFTWPITKEAGVAHG